jgi:hypothetical protein
LLKVIIRRLALTLWCLLACMIFLHLVALQAKADGTQVKITQPSVNGNPIGHPGTKVTISGSGFPAGSTLNLYTTPSGDPAKCTVNGDPAANGLTLFASNPTVMVQGDSTFSVDTTWPDNAAMPTTVYYICAATQGAQGLSSNTFTVAQPVAINVTPVNVVQGDQVTVNGANWLPPQQLNVSIIAGEGSPPIVSDVVTPGPDGTFSTILTIPGDAGAAPYAVRVYATNETSMTVTQNNALTVTQSTTATPTPTAAPPTPTASAPTQTTGVPTSTPATTTTSGGGASIVTFLIYFLGGIGTLFVLIGVIMFVVYSHA